MSDFCNWVIFVAAALPKDAHLAQVSAPLFALLYVKLMCETQTELSRYTAACFTMDCCSAVL